MMSLQDPLLSKLKKDYIILLKSKETKRKKFKDKIGQLKNFYIPICDKIYKRFKNKTLIIGLSGGQGAGKTTSAEIIKLILKIKFGLNVINFSIDDYYKSRKDRNILATRTSKLFFTRGVPGTHYSNLLFLVLFSILKRTQNLVLLKKLKSQLN